MIDAGPLGRSLKNIMAATVENVPFLHALTNVVIKLVSDYKLP
jgi:hypothetical protein